MIYNNKTPKKNLKYKEREKTLYLIEVVIDYN